MFGHGAGHKTARLSRQKWTGPHISKRIEGTQRIRSDHQTDRLHHWGSPHHHRRQGVQEQWCPVSGHTAQSQTKNRKILLCQRRSVEEGYRCGGGDTEEMGSGAIEQKVAFFDTMIFGHYELCSVGLMHIMISGHYEFWYYYEFFK